jgi:hypothetical protein
VGFSSTPDLQLIASAFTHLGPLFVVVVKFLPPQEDGPFGVAGLSHFVVACFTATATTELFSAHSAA